MRDKRTRNLSGTGSRTPDWWVAHLNESHRCYRYTIPDCVKEPRMASDWIAVGKIVPTSIVCAVNYSSKVLFCFCYVDHGVWRVENSPEADRSRKSNCPSER